MAADAGALDAGPIVEFPAQDCEPYDRIFAEDELKRKDFNMRVQKSTLAVGMATVAGAVSVATAALLGVLVNSPSITFEDFGGTATSYNSASLLFSVDSNAVGLQINPGDTPILITGGPFGALQLDVFVTNSGVLAGGHPGEDFIVSGTVVINSVSYSGTLLTGEAIGFGHDDTGGTTDLYDFRLVTTGGLLTAPGLPFDSSDIGVRLTSENSTFTGSFDTNFGGKAKGIIGAIPTSLGDAGGCTPGYWKQPHHFDSWPAPYAPSTLFESVFARDVPGNPTLLEALRIGGGGINALMRHSTAALLNAASPGVHPDTNFDTVIEVLNAFRTAYDSGDYNTNKNLLEASNELGCPLN